MSEQRHVRNNVKEAVFTIFLGFLVLIVPAIAYGISAPSQLPGSDSLVIYSQNNEEMITVEKYGEILQEKGYLRHKSFSLTIVDDKDDNELRLIEGKVGEEQIQGKISRREYSMELTVAQTGKNVNKITTATSELRGERLEIDCLIEKSGAGASRLDCSLYAFNTPNKIRVFSEEDNDKTAFYILFSLPKMKIFGSNRGAAVDYIISIKEERTWLSSCDLIIGSINLVLTGYFIL